ncbi:hypothetical protein BDN70DRAFT_885519 [Pholiota conissans]|uniref:Uncharacterized protein n=1 Tax=Pholiota conissans TaxID=109636 RepID=A0A9P6CUC3_9AGAR|nr:hypothetical protein BDN70DRAFT_885519 [Pholiota conissans]
MRRQTWTFFGLGVFDFMISAVHPGHSYFEHSYVQLPAPNVDKFMSTPSFGLMTWPFPSFKSALLLKL